MHITEFAEQIVFGKSLEEKLTRPGQLVFGPKPNRNSVGEKTLESLPSPARPRELAMHDGPGLSQPPTDRELSNEKARGQLLHFLANHELLATELMALVLLKFPDAPIEFQRGVLVTLQEEQTHTRLYLKRMKECQVEFGAYPLSGHFWRVVEPMRDPMDFVSRLSLTFEQANLDYSLHYANVFGQLGDTRTAKILHRVYQDEITHVQHGLQWFRKWKSPEQSDWDAFQSQLEFPMSPQRARGPKCEFNREGRKTAGLDEHFIDAVEVYRQSRGRPPTVRWFEPATEAQLAGTLRPKQEKLMAALHRDLDPLMLWLSKEDDVVLVREPPTREYRKYLLQLGVELPEFVSFEEIESLQVRKLAAIEPWAWTPAVRGMAECLLGSTASIPVWQESQRDLFRKSWAADKQCDWLPDQSRCFAKSSTSGIRVASLAEFEAVGKQHLANGYRKLLFKTDLGTSGRGQRRFVSDSPLDKVDADWLVARLATQPGVLEPELDRQVDLSFLFHMQDELEFLGWTRPIVSPSRRFAGTYLRRPFSDCSPEIKRFLLANDCDVLHQTKDWLVEHLTNELRSRQFRGLCGVDAMVFAATEGLRVKPIVEFNPRCTMGHIALQLEERVSTKSSGEFRILRANEYRQLQPQLDATAMEFAADGRWIAGYVRLSEPVLTTGLVPVAVVGPAARAALSFL